VNQIWANAAARTNGESVPEDFEIAAYRLITEQVLYYADRASRVAYWLIERHERDFRQVLEPFGVDVQVNRQLQYVYALPRHAKMGTATVGQTLLALVLRGLYDDAARSGNLNDNGEASCDLVELAEKYRLATGRDLPMRGELEASLRVLRRWGIARKEEVSSDGGAEEGSGQPFVVTIRPAIADVLGEAALQRLAHWNDHVRAHGTALSDEQVAEDPAGETHVES